MVFFAAFSSGLISSPFLQFSLTLILINFIFLLILKKTHFHIYKSSLLFLLLFQSGILIGSLSIPKPPKSTLLNKLEKEEKKLPIWIEGRILSSEKTLDGSKAIIEISSYYEEDKKIQDKIKMVGYFPIDPPDPLSRFKGCFYISLPKTKTNPGQFDYRKSLNDKGIYLSAELKEPNLYTTLSKNPITKIINIYKDMIRSQIIANCGKESGVVLALLLGERGMIEEKDEFSLIRSGLYHLIALSGLHIGIIVLVLYFVLNSFRLNPFLTDFIILSFLPIYSLIIKDQPSVIRAIVMAFIFIIARMAGRQNATFNSLFVSFTLMLSFNPLQIRDVGFQLTFLATLGIISLYPSKNIFFKESALLDYVFKLFFIGFSAQLFTFPVLIYSFQRISPFSFLATPLASFFLFPLLAFGVIFIFGGSLVPLFNSFLLLIVKLFAKCFLLVPYYASKFNFSSLFFPEPHFVYAFIFALCIIAIVFIKKTKRIVFVLAFILTTFVSYYFPDPFNSIKKDFLAVLDVGQGNCLLAHIAGKNFLIDCADTSYHSVPTSRSVIEPFLSFIKTKKIDGIFITHWDKDHSGSLKEILNDIETKFIGFPSCPDAPSDIKDFLTKRKIKTMSLKREDQIELSSLKIHILHPECNLSQFFSENDLSLVFSLSFYNKKIIFTGDIEKKGQKNIVESNGLPEEADILIVPHHGAKNSFFVPFIEKTKPKIAIFSAGKNNRFNHPNPAVVDYYRSMNSRIFRTDKDGAILIVFDKDKLKVLKYAETYWDKEIFK